MIFLLYWLFALVAIARAVADDVSHGTIGINEAAFLKGIVVAEAPVPHSAHIPVHVTFLQVVSDRQNVSSSHIEEIDTVFADWQPGGSVVVDWILPENVTFSQNLKARVSLNPRTSPSVVEPGVTPLFSPQFETSELTLTLDEPVTLFHLPLRASAPAAPAGPWPWASLDGYSLPFFSPPADAAEAQVRSARAAAALATLLALAGAALALNGRRVQVHESEVEPRPNFGLRLSRGKSEDAGIDADAGADEGAESGRPPLRPRVALPPSAAWSGLRRHYRRRRAIARALSPLAPSGNIGSADVDVDADQDGSEWRWGDESESGSDDTYSHLSAPRARQPAAATSVRAAAWRGLPRVPTPAVLSPFSSRAYAPAQVSAPTAGPLLTALPLAAPVPAAAAATAAAGSAAPGLRRSSRTSSRSTAAEEPAPLMPAPAPAPVQGARGSSNSRSGSKLSLAHADDGGSASEDGGENARPSARNVVAPAPAIHAVSSAAAAAALIRQRLAQAGRHKRVLLIASTESVRARGGTGELTHDRL